MNPTPTTEIDVQLGRPSAPMRRRERLGHGVVGAWVNARYPRRDERGLSQSTENALLLAGAATIALGIVTFIAKYVTDRMPE